MRYIVIGVWDHQGDDDTELIIAGVVAGDAPLVDTGGETTGYTRFATVVDADSPDEAEQLALTQAGTTES